MTGKEIVNLIRVLREKGLSAEEILKIIEYVETHDPKEDEIEEQLYMTGVLLSYQKVIIYQVDKCNAAKYTAKGYTKPGQKHKTCKGCEQQGFQHTDM